MKFNPLVSLSAGAAALVLCSLAPQSAAIAMPATSIQHTAGVPESELQQVRVAGRGGFARRGAVYRRSGVAVVRRGVVVGGGYAGSGYYDSACNPNYQDCGGGAYYSGGVYRGGAAVIRRGAVVRRGAIRGGHVARFGRRR